MSLRSFTYSDVTEVIMTAAYPTGITTQYWEVTCFKSWFKSRHVFKTPEKTLARGLYGVCTRCVRTEETLPINISYSTITRHTAPFVLHKIRTTVHGTQHYILAHYSQGTLYNYSSRISNFIKLQVYFILLVKLPDLLVQTTWWIGWVLCSSTIACNSCTTS